MENLKELEVKGNRSDNALSALAESLFVTDKGGRVKLEYPFLFVALAIGMLVSVVCHFKFKVKKND